MLSRAEIQSKMDAHAANWGKCGYPDWLQVHQHSTLDKVIEDGVKHGCPVIPMVVNRDRLPSENCEAYGLKRYSFSAVADTLGCVGHFAVFLDWTYSEIRKPEEQTDISLANEVMYPAGIDPRILPACNRIPQVLYADLFRNLALASDGQRLDLASTRQEQDKFVLPLKGLTDIARHAISISDFTATFATHTAEVLIVNGVDKDIVVKLLVVSVVKPSLIKETGQRLPAQQMVLDICRKMGEKDSLNALSADFINQAQTLIF